jgi:hypothetical protein
MEVHILAEKNWPVPELVSVDELVRRWAPLVWLAPEERYFPSGVSDFLQHVTARRNDAQLSSGVIPEGQSSENWYLVTKQSVGTLTFVICT